MKKPFFTIIIPVYNVEHYLRRCADSILNQTFTDFQAIFINDGSTDKSGEICEEIGNDPRTLIIHKQNGGASSARNYALDKAIGLYVLFLDSDDYLDNKDALQKIYNQIQTYSNDVVIFGYKLLYINTNFRIEKRITDAKKLNDIQDKSSVLLNLFKNGNFPGSAWMMCVNSDIIENNHLRFPLGVTGEDIIWINKVLINSQSVGCIEDSFYIYLNNRPGQITSRHTLNGCNGMLMAIKDWLNIKDITELPAVSFQMAHVYLVLLMFYSDLCKNEREAIIEDVKNSAKILKAGTFKDNLIFLLIKLFNPYIIGLLIRNIYKFVQNLLKIKYNATSKK